MRNALLLDSETVITIDNAGCIGEKELDTVFAPNSIVATFCLRVSILEQWCAGANPEQILVANFTGDLAWEDYMSGFQTIYDEIGEQLPKVTGSTETNFNALQSGLSVTVIGKKQFNISHENVEYFIVGEPLVGTEVLEKHELVAKLDELYKCLRTGVIKALWPCGSKGIQHEIERFTGKSTASFNLDGAISAGPSTAVLVAVDKNDIDIFRKAMTAPITTIET